MSSTATITIEFDQDRPTDTDVHEYLRSMIERGPGWLRWDLDNDQESITDAQDV